VGTSGTQLLAALPIREQPSFPPETGLSPLEAAFVLAVLAAIALAIAISWRRRRRARPAFDEGRARTAMESLCRQGWTAQVTLYGAGAPLPDDAPQADGVRVRLDWSELSENEDGDREVVVTRRLWSRSLSGALRAMVADRRLDAQLEEIERAPHR
jgi:hypothetical protein